MKTFCAILLSVASLNAATYYIDYDSGSDANNGTAKETPWKHVPVMEDFSGSYSHTDGDQFIFKGGVTWPRAAVPLYITEGGAAGNHDYYGVDVTWFEGGAFTRPVFDGEGLAFVNHTSVHRENMIRIVGSDSQYVTLDNLELKGWRFTNPIANTTDGCGVNLLSTGNITLTNMYIHSWTVATTSEGGGGVGNLLAVSSGEFWIYDSIIEGPSAIAPQFITSPGGWTGGTAIRGFNVIRCDISGTTQGAWDTPILWDSIIHEGGNSYNSVAHENAIRIHGNSHTRNNRVWTWEQGVGVFMVPGWGGDSPRRAWTYNNIFWDIPQLNVGSGDTQTVPNENESWFVNNIIVDQLTSVGARDGRTQGPVVRANNLFINNNGSLTSGSLLKSDGTPDIEINSNNVLIDHSTAAALGMTEENNWEPTGELASIFNQGLNFSTDVLETSSLSPLIFDTDFNDVSRPIGAEWDIGAYEFGEAEPSPGELTLSASTYEVGESEGNATISVNRVGGTVGSVGVTYSTSDNTAETGSDYTGTTNTLSWSDSEGGTKNFLVAVAGDEAEEGNETFFVEISNPTGGATLGGITSASVTITDDDGGNPIPLMDDLGPFEAEAGLIEGLFTVSGGTVFQTSQTLNPGDGGLARWRVTIPSTGNYKVTMAVDAPNTASDSFHVEFDEEPTTPADIWDIQSLTDGVEARDVTLRGSGAFDNPEFDPMVWNLEAGEHILYLRGREAGAKADAVTISSVGGSPPDAPTGLSVTLQSDLTVDLSWTDNAADETGYKIERRQEPFEDWLEADAISADSTSYEDSFVEPGETYLYRVRAFNASGNSAYTAEGGVYVFVATRGRATPGLLSIGVGP